MVASTVPVNYMRDMVYHVICQFASYEEPTHHETSVRWWSSYYLYASSLNGSNTLNEQNLVKTYHTHGFELYIPAMYRSLLDTYLSQLKPETKGKSRFLKNWNAKAGYRVQNTGRDKVQNAVKDF